jgi:hypothetical protein
MKAGPGTCFVAKEVEEVPLRHHGDERCRSVEVRQIGDGPLASGDMQPGLVDPVVRPLQESLQHSKLVEDLHGRGMDGVAPEIAKKIGMLLKHLNPATGAREQQSGHHSRRSAANDDEVAVRTHPARLMGFERQ